MCAPGHAAPYYFGGGSTLGRLVSFCYPGTVPSLPPGASRGPVLHSPARDQCTPSHKVLCPFSDEFSTFFCDPAPGRLPVSEPGGSAPSERRTKKTGGVTGGGERGVRASAPRGAARRALRVAGTTAAEPRAQMATAAARTCARSSARASRLRCLRLPSLAICPSGMTYSSTGTTCTLCTRLFFLNTTMPSALAYRV